MQSEGYKEKKSSGLPAPSGAGSLFHQTYLSVVSLPAPYKEISNPTKMAKPSSGKVSGVGKIRFAKAAVRQGRFPANPGLAAILSST
jgi:hypothetical protein